MSEPLRGFAVAKNQDGRLELVAIAHQDGWPRSLWLAWQTTPGGDWTGWHSLGIPPSLGVANYSPFRDPKLARNADGHLEVFVVDNNTGSLWHRLQRKAGRIPWSDWDSLGQPAPYGLGAHLAVAQNQDGRLEVFGISGTELWHSWQQTSGGWSPWESLHSPVEAGLGWLLVTRNRDGRLEVFATDDYHGSLWHCWQQTSGRWSDWKPLERPETDSIGFLAVGANADGRLLVVAVVDGRLWQREQAISGGWSAWAQLTRPAVKLWGPVLASGDQGRLELLLLTSVDQGVYRVYQTTPNSSEWRTSIWAPPPTSFDLSSFEPAPAGEGQP